MASTETLPDADAETAVEAQSHSEHESGTALSNAAAPVLPRSRTMQVGTAFGTAGLLMYFAGLFAVYLAERANHISAQEAAETAVPWIPGNAQVELTAPTIMAWTLLMSTITMQWAVYSFKRNDRRHGLLALALQIVFGLAVINQHVFQWDQLGLVADNTASSAAPMIYAITGSFVVAMAVTLFFLFLMAFRTMSGAQTSQNVDGIASVAVVWYALVAIYFVIWILVFITK